MDILRITSQQWMSCDGTGLVVSPVNISKAEFTKILLNDYSQHVNPKHDLKTYGLLASGIKITIHVSARSRPSSITIKLLKACLSSLTTLYGPAKYKNLILFLVENDEDKFAVSPLTKRKVNTGFSQANTIAVYRCQEMHKVLVHELMHFWGTHDNFADQYAVRLVQRLGAPKDCLLFEGYVESIATIMMCGFCAKSGTPQERLQRETSQVFRSAKQVVMMEQIDTNVWAYYIARACLFACQKEFFSWLHTNSGTRKLKGPLAWKSFADIIEKGMKKLGGPTLNKLQSNKTSIILRSCDCNLGPSFN